MKNTYRKIKPALNYTLAPQIMPRVRNLFFSGFSYISFFMAQTYRSVRLLPDGHPYLAPANIGKFGVRHVIAEAGNNLVFKKENIDQIIVFMMMLIGIIIVMTQFFMLFLAGFVEVAHAGLYASSSPLDFFSYFRTPDATNELAFVLLDRVFGIPGTAGPVGTSFFADVNGGYSCVVTGQPCFTNLAESFSSREQAFIAPNVVAPQVAGSAGPLTYSVVPAGQTFLTFPWPYHTALRAMLQFYSIGLLVIAVIIFLYFFFVVAVETAQTGTAYGKRFNHLWAPIRVVVAIGMLMPISYGLNPAQWILMYAVKWGSSFATNGWIIYSNALAGEDTLLGPAEEVVAQPNTPPVNTLLQFGTMLATCKVGYERLFHDRVTRDPIVIDAWLVNVEDITLAPERLVANSFQQAVDYFNGQTIHIRFGELRDADEGNQMWEGRVAPWCGELTIDMTYVPENIYQAGNAVTEPGSWYMLRQYYELVVMLWNDASDGGAVAAPDGCGFVGGGGGGGGIAGVFTPAPLINFHEIGVNMASRHISICNDADAPLPTPDQLASLRMGYQGFLNTRVQIATILQAESTEWEERLTDLGWGGAGIWYNKIAQLNGGLISSVYSMPKLKKYPYIVEETRKRRGAADDGISGEGGTQIQRGQTDDILPFDDGEEEELAKALNQARTIWFVHESELPKRNDPIRDSINALFGTAGLMNITSNEAQNVHPLALLASIGRSLVDSAIQNLGYSFGAGLASGLANLASAYQVGSFASTAGSFFFQVAMITLAMGFVLFYIVPLLPFLYFFFAVGGWIKSIFEAMVGVPLWALAHIRIDGDGLPGGAALSGYYLVLEIFLRPILIIFGFIASIMIFGAQVRILHDIWGLIITNVSGANAAAAKAAGLPGGTDSIRNEVDEIFFTMIYAIICYMMAMASFKLVDQVPNHILRWMGASVSTFGDMREDPAQDLVRNSFFATNQIGGQLRSAYDNAAKSIESGTAALRGLSARGQGQP